MNFTFFTRIHFSEVNKSIWGKPSSVPLGAASCRLSHRLRKCLFRFDKSSCEGWGPPETRKII